MKTEPAVVGAAIAAVLNAIVLLVFKTELGTEEKAAILTVVNLAAGLFIRANVTPVP
jgi:hypothetical protein